MSLLEINHLFLYDILEMWEGSCIEIFADKRSRIYCYNNDYDNISVNI